jgi:hypothetical protein
MINVPDNIKKELEEKLKELYPKQHSSPYIQYSKGSSNTGIKYKAEVTYGTRIPLSFECKEETTVNGYKYHWYCTYDWND